MDKPVLFIIPGACAFGSQVTLEWINEAYQVGLTTPEIRASSQFKAINPSGKVGALKDGNNVVGENLAILLYLADKYQHKGICPSVGTQERAHVYQWLSYLSSTLHPAFGQVNFPARFVTPEAVDVFRKMALERLIAVLNYVNNSFNSHGLLVMDKPTIVEAQAYGLLRWSKGFHGNPPVVDINDFPKIKAFFELMEKDKAVKNALLIEAGNIDNLNNSQFAGYFLFD